MSENGSLECDELVLLGESRVGDQLRLRRSRFTRADLDLHPLLHEHTHTVRSNANPCCTVEICACNDKR